MSMLLLAVLTVAVAPVEGAEAIAAPAATAQQPLVSPRTGRELEEATRAALRRWAKVNDPDADQAAREFLVLHDELQRDEKLASALREPLRQKVRGRLMALAQQIARRLAIQRRLAEQRGQQPPSVEAGGVLAQWGGQGGMMGGGPMGGGMMGGGPMGGGMMGGGMMGGPMIGPLVEDNGEQLVDLIQKTIAPATWDVLGGPGSIYYWRSGHSLIIRQTDEVHGDIVNLIEQLNRAQQ